MDRWWRNQRNAETNIPGIIANIAAALILALTILLELYNVQKPASQIEIS